MSNEEKRALEIYITILLQRIRKDNTNALKHIKALFYSMAFFDNYDPEFLYNVCTINLEKLDKLPTNLEIALAFNLNTPLIKFSRTKIKKIYEKRVKPSLIRYNNFAKLKISLQPKILDKYFHEELLTFLKNFSIIGVTIPIK